MPEGLITGGELFESEGAPLEEAQSRVLSGSRGKLFESDGSMKVAIIRPCVSRGKRLRNLPPIYTPQMLERNAAVFSNWPMYEDHMMEQAAESFREELLEHQMGDLLEFLEERARRIKELGGRVRESYWDSSVTFADDAEMGYQRGAVVGEAIPQRRIREMLEDDPEILNVSINAWPSGAREGVAPWDRSTRGMLIEGIRRKPQGSVDWVFRGGAGGRPLLAEQDFEVAACVLESLYSASSKGKNPLTKDSALETELKNLKPDQLREYLQENDLDHLVPALREGEAARPAPAALKPEEIKAMVQEAVEETVSSIREEEEEEAATLREARSLQAAAHEMLSEANKNGLPDGWTSRLKEKYTVSGEHVPESLRLTEQEDKPLTEILKEAVEADIRDAVELIRESGGNPRITGLAPVSEGDGDGEGEKAPRKQSRFVQFLRESGDIKPDGDKSEVEQLSEVLQEGKAI